MYRRRRTFAILLLACAQFLAVGCTRNPAAPPNIVVVLIDTLRADRVSPARDRRGLTPFLDSLAGRGASFDNAYAASSWTMPSVASLFTSRYPTQQHVNTVTSKLADNEITLAELLGARGYTSAGFSANYLIGPAFGFAQGFDNWRTVAPSEAEAAKVRGDVVRGESQRWLDEQRAHRPTAPVFLYYQFMEPHAPYEPPEPFRSRFGGPHDPDSAARANLRLAKGDLWGAPPDQIALLTSLYDAEVAAADEEVRRLYVDLEQKRLLDNTVLVITADHGEEFGEHGGLGHGYTLYNEQLQVPLIIVGPGIAARRIGEPVSLVDVAPTLLELAGVSPPPPGFEGRSLVPLLTGRAAPQGGPVDVIAELERSGEPADLRFHNAALVRGSIKLLRSTNLYTRAQVFDLAKDPGERSPDPPELVAERDALFDVLLTKQDGLRIGVPAPEQVKLDEATREKLRALGYHHE